MNVDVEKLIGFVDRAEKEVLKIYREKDFAVEYKDDNSPVTLADKKCEEVLIENLRKSYPEIPILSEETQRSRYKQRKEWEYLWVIDPLDGTKEFIKKNGEFTINLALVYNGQPVFGLVSIPAKEVIYFAEKNRGAFKKEKGTEPVQIFPNSRKRDKIVIAKSRSHSSEKDRAVISQLGEVQETNAGSSLKFCYVAEGKADVYLRGGRTMEWDTAAGQCIAESAGAKVFDFQGCPLKYNKKSLLNPRFVCVSPISEFESRVRTSLQNTL